MGRTRAVSNWSSRWAGLVKVLGGILLGALLLAPVRSLDAALPATHRVTLLWDRNPSADGITGYRIYFGTASGSYSDYVAVENVTAGAVTGLADGVTYYFAVTAHDGNGLESGFSDEVIYTPRLPRMQTHLAPGGSMVLSVQGPPGHLYFIEASEDLLNWTVIDIVYLESGTAVEVTDPDGASYAKRFYRMLDVSQ